MAHEKIEANYEQLGEIASSFSECHDSIQQMLNKLSGVIDELRSTGWIGRGSDAFFGELQDDVMPRMQKLVTALDEANHAVGSVAEIMQNGEEEASGLFRH